MFTALPCSVAIPIPMSGERVESAASLDRAQLDFGTYSACPTTIIRVDSTFRIVNNGLNEITVQVPQVRPPFYLLTDFPAPKPVAPGASLPIQIQYRPFGADLNQGVAQQIAFPFTSLTCSDTLRAQLQAASYQPILTAEEGVIDLGVLLSCSAEIDTIVTITNPSLIPVTVDRITSSDGVSLIGGPVTIAPTSSQNLPIRIVAPTTAGPVTLRGNIISPTCDLSIPIELEGLLIDPVYTPSSTSLTLGTYSSCRDTSRPTSTLVIVAKGLAGLRSRINDVAISGPFTTSITTGSFFRDTLIIDVTATGGLVEGVNAGSLKLSVGPCQAEYTFPLTVSATARRWSAQLLSTTIGPLGAGETASTSLTVSNNGTDTIVISSVDGLTAPFSLAAPLPNLPVSLGPAESFQVQIEYSFTGYDRTDRQQVNVRTSGLCADTVSLSLQGTTRSEGTITGVMIVAPLDVVGTAGQTVEMPLALESLVSLDRADLREVSIYLSYDASVIRPLVAGNGSRGETATVIESVPGRSVITVTHNQPIVPTQQLTRLAFQTYLAPVSSTPVTIDSVIARNVEITGRDGRVTVLGSCIIAAELADLRNRIDLRVVSSTSSSVSIDVETITHDPSRVAMYSASGACVAVPLMAQLTPGRYSLQFDVTSLASGTYLIVLEHGRHVRHSTVSITR